MNGLPSLFITGTDTGAGKTVIAALLLKAYQMHGINVVPFKPVAAGSKKGPEDEDLWADTAFLAAVAGIEEKEVGLFRLKKALSPHLAAAAEDVEIEIAAIAQRFHFLKSKHDAVLVEGAGGIMAPVSDNATLLDVAQALGLPVVVVTGPRLGTLNHTLLTVSACRERGLEVAGLVINRCGAEGNEGGEVDEGGDESGQVEQSNLIELGKLTRVPVLGWIPEMDVSVDKLRPGDLEDMVERLDLSRLGTRKPDYGPAIEADRDHVWHPFSPMLEYLSEKPHPLMIVAAEDCHLIDSGGRRYIDGTASLWVNIHGHRRPELDQAVRRQLNRVAHSTLLGLSNEPSALLARELAQITPPGLSRVFFSDNGSTAVEVALKVAFQYWRQSGHPQKKEFISFVNAYHGDTIGAVSVGGMDLFHSIFRPLLFEAHLVPAAFCYRCPVDLSYPDCQLSCLKDLARTLEERTGSIAAVIVEPMVQGAAGILVQPPGYLREISRLCRQAGVLLIADEVATGFGRTGTLFACEQEDVQPDIMALAKGVTGGYLPLAATLFKEEIYEAFLGSFEELKTFFHGHTYTGNPLACAAALANIGLVKRPEFIAGVREKAWMFESLLEPLKEMKHVGDVRMMGLMAGIELVADRGPREPFPPGDRMARRVILKAREKGVIIRPLGDTVVIMPPLAISGDELKQLVDAAAWAITEVTECGNG